MEGYNVVNGGEKKIKHYSSAHQILLVGEGDFSFAACLANAFGSAANMIATSRDSREMLMQTRANLNLIELKERGRTVVHGVDANTMSYHPLLCGKSFDRIVFNFLHAGFMYKENSYQQIEMHQNLVMRGFLRSARNMLKEKWEVHVTHKTSNPFDRWEIEKLAAEVGLSLVEKARFYEYYYPGYKNKRGSGYRCDESFPVEQLIGLLVSGTSNRSVVAVVGEGGLGKTTLAGKIYKNDRVKKHFDCQAWITVGKECTKMDILRKAIQEFEGVTGPTYGEMDKMEENDLLSTLGRQLKDKCYMVVFDDVWKADFWGYIEYALTENNKSSRIMLTTRNKGIVDLIPFVNVCRIQPLPSDKAFELFRRKAFGPQGCCPPELEKLSHDILRKCGGLPLAIVAVGGLLSNKDKATFEWKKLLDDLGSRFRRDSHLKDCNKVLLEGYYGLPHHLKSCLLYFGFFPESYSINCARLIRLWIAEGFVPHSKRLTSEQVAEKFLIDLINRSLVQVVETDFVGRPRYCRVHDLMHEIILRKTEYLGFSHFVNRETQISLAKKSAVSIQGALIVF
ncbi:disease resistance protein RPM1-like [Pistacia vera]|uniref:disease resistance protein RPM1-like n=1 Tax=Pistacia vera TaxID=55513 RepID=UPI001263C809|nr:disease resistance protein RPM1-like [Pistacia vera]